jgi:hypothetical protein
LGVILSGEDGGICFQINILMGQTNP